MAITRAMTDVYNGPGTAGEILSPTIDLGTGDGVPSSMTTTWSSSSIFGGDSSTSTTSYVGYRFATGTIDLSTRTYVGWQMANTSLSRSAVETFANGGVRVVFDDGTNWAAYVVYGGNFTPFSAGGEGSFAGFLGFASNNQSLSASWFLDRANRTAYASSGTLNWGAVTHIEVHMKPAFSGRMQIAMGRILTADAPIFTGTVSNNVWEDGRNFYGDSGNGYPFPWVFRPAALYALSSFQAVETLQIGLQIGDGSTTTTLSDSNVSVAMWGTPEDYANNVPPNSTILVDTPRLIDVYQSATDSVTLSDSLISSQSQVGWRVRGSTSGTASFPRLTFSPFNQMELGHGSYEDCVWADGTVPVEITADTALTGGIIRDSEGLEITSGAGDYSAITVRLANNTTYDVIAGAGGAGTYNIAGVTAPAGYTVKLRNNSATNAVTFTFPAGITYSTSTAGGSITVDAPVQTFTFNSDTSSTLIRYFENDSQTVVDSATGVTLDYEFPDADPVDVEFLKQGYVPVNRQNVIPVDGASLDVLMDFDEAYNSAHGLVAPTDYTYNRLTKVLTIVADQEAKDVRSALADLIRTDASYYNTPLLMEAIPGLTRIDLIDGASISSMATWKGAGMERFDAADPLNPTEKWFAVKSVGNITGATAYYRQTSSGSATQVTLTNDVVNEAFQYWSDPNHDGSTADGFDYSDYMVIKTFLAGARQARIDIYAASGLAALNSNLFTVPLANEPHGYAGTDPGISADITLVAGGVFGGETFAYEIVDGGTNTGADIANQLHYNRVNTPNAVIPGGTGLTYWELPDAVIFNATAVETERGFREGATPAQVGFYVSRGGSDHPSFTRFQADNGNYYVPAEVVEWAMTNALDGSRVRLYNETAASEIDNSTVSGGGGYSYTLTPGVDFTSGDVLTMLVTYQQAGVAKRVFRFSTTVTSANVTINDSQADWDEPNVLAIDGSTVSECTTDYIEVQTEVNDLDDTTQKSRIAAFIVDAITTADGIRNWVSLSGNPVIRYFNAGAAQIDASVAAVEVINVKAASTLSVKDTFEFDWSDGVDRVSAVSGSSIIWLTPARVLLQETGVSGLTPTESAQLATIDAVAADVDLVIQDQGLDASNPKTITENTPGESYDEAFSTVTKEIRKVGNTTTITRTA